jgi:hypothetical protein
VARTDRLVDRGVVWVARIGWVLVAVVGGAAPESALDGRGPAVSWVTGIGGWTTWAAVAVALAIPAVVTLTVVRVGAPLALVAAAACLLAGASTIDSALLAVTGAVTALAAFTPEFAQRWIEASAYGDEVRLPLRCPAAVAFAAGATWVVWSACLVAGPLLLAARRPIPGVALTVVAVIGTVLLGPRWHRLSRRWLVFVPAGLVVHDPVVLGETLMLRRDQVDHLGLALAGTGALDLTGPASGHAVEISTTESVTTVLAPTPTERNGRAVHTSAFLVSPLRPGATLQVAIGRGFAVRS